MDMPAQLDLRLAKLQVSKNVPNRIKPSSSSVNRQKNIRSPYHEISDVLGQSWFISLGPLCPCLYIFLLPELAVSPLYSNQVASSTPAFWLGVREEEEEGSR